MAPRLWITPPDLTYQFGWPVGPVLVTIQPSPTIQIIQPTGIRPVLHVGIQQLVFQRAQKHVGLLGHEKDLR